MSRFNAPPRTGVRSPVITLPVAETGPVRTAQGGEGFLRDAYSELFLLSVSNMSSDKDDFYESARQRDSRFVALLHSVASDTEWVTGFVTFLRTKAMIRTASIVAAAEIVKARLAAGVQGNRQIIAAALQRPDEPGELLAYWISKYGKAIPKPVKRGISDACQRLFHERSLIKWDSKERAYRFADILQLVHAEPSGPVQSALYKHILNERYRTDAEVYIPEALPILRANRKLMELPVEQRLNVTHGQLAEAGLTWEILAGWGQSAMDAARWESVIPTMGAMALVRNLRNFDKAGINKAASRLVEDKITDPEEIRKSRQLPMRFLSAYRATRDSGTVTAWGPSLETALNLSLGNVPQLPGRTLVMVDLSGSMGAPIAGSRSDLSRKDGAAIFGAALAKRSETADLVGFSNDVWQFQFEKFSSVLPLADTIVKLGGGGTATGDALATAYQPGVHDRVVILTDEQAGYGYGHGQRQLSEVLPQVKVPVYTWNLAGFQAAQMESGRNRFTFGGLNDSSFRVISLIEQGAHQDWKSLFAQGND